MKEGDILRTFTTIPKNPIRPVEGDSHPLGEQHVKSRVARSSKIFGERSVKSLL